VLVPSPRRITFGGWRTFSLRPGKRRSRQIEFGDLIGAAPVGHARRRVEQGKAMSGEEIGLRGPAALQIAPVADARRWIARRLAGPAFATHQFRQVDPFGRPEAGWKLAVELRFDHVALPLLP
jgi:hypothetical protein